MKSKKTFAILVLSAVIIVSSLILCLTIINDQESIMLPNCAVSTKVDAVEKALPFAQVYAQENNRTITTVDSEVFYVHDRPCWQITINFKAVKNHEHAFRDHPYGVYAYCVLIWADTGEVQAYNEQGWV